MERLRVAHIIPDGEVGGAQEYLASLAAEHAAAGIGVLIVTAERGPFVRRYREAAPVLVLPELAARLKPLHHIRAAAALRRIVAEHNVDVIHGHTSRGLIHAALLRSLGRRPAVVSIHGFNSAHALMSPAAAAVATRIKRSASCRVDALTVAARAIQDVVIALGIPREKVHVVYAGIDIRRFHPQTERPPGPLRVGAAGRLIPIKGFRTYIEAACTLLDRGAAAEFELLGDGPDEPALRAMVESAGHTSQIRFQRFRNDFPDVLRQWDVAVVPSIVDSFPFVPLEAMATGVPVVVSAVGGVPEAVRDGVEGLLVPPGDATALASALRRVLADESLRRRMGAAGVATVRQRFTWRRAAEDYMALYERILGRAAARH